MTPPTPILLLLLASILLAASGLPSVLLGWRSRVGQPIATALVLAGCLLGLVVALPALFRPAVLEGSLGATLPLGEWRLRLDALSAVFLVPVFLLGGLGSIYGTGYWRQADRPSTGRRLQFFYGLLLAAMTLVLLAADGIAFLMAWEAMAVSAFFLVATEDYEPDVRKAGWLYLVSTHAGTLCLMAMFALLSQTDGSFLLQPVIGASPNVRSAIFLLALLGFGLKAGVMPLHVWLPAAHACAPSHVSALLSGVMIKMGIYGLLRITSLLPEPPRAWGGLLLLLGSASAVLGVAYAIGQHDLKRLLAYHSVENIGIIVVGLGLALLGRSAESPAWVALGLAGCLLHVWNHALFKSLLFLGAGAVIHGARSRHLDHLGGLGKVMPFTSVLFLVGAVAICGLPPLNGFVSELLIYLGLFRTLGLAGDPAWGGAAVAAPVLAMVGALAVACFVKVYGTTFLGQARTAAAAGAREAPRAMRLPMVVLALCCVAIGLLPQWVVPALDRAVAVWAGETALPAIAAFAPLGLLSGAAVAIAVVALGTCLVVKVALRRRVRRDVPTWDCGYARPSARMQYTASSFAGTLVGLFGWALRPAIDYPRIDGLAPAPASYVSRVDDVVLEKWLLPVGRSLARALSRLHVLQQGQVQKYLLYIFVVVLVLLLSAIPLSSILEYMRSG